ncbi:MAG: universal stress protein [Anaerolineae bacterium]|nr:universal stress protein [Anaerolineae bacterium]
MSSSALNPYYNIAHTRATREIAAVAATHYTKILVPLDGSGLSERAVVRAMELARTHHAELHLVHVYKSGNAALLSDSTLLDQQTHRQAQVNAQRYVNAQANKLKKQGIKAVASIVEAGDMTATVSKFVANHDIDLVVMNAAQNKLERFFFGDTANKIHANTGVEVITEVN